MSVTRDAPRGVATADVTVLAFDFGTKKIGVAVGNTAYGIAHPLTTIIDERDARALRGDHRADRRMAARRARRRTSVARRRRRSTR